MSCNNFVNRLTKRRDIRGWMCLRFAYPVQFYTCSMKLRSRIV